MDEKNVYVFRPYVHTADFLCTAGVITYVGHEAYSMPLGDGTVRLLARRPPEETRDKLRAIKLKLEMAITEGNTPKALELLRNF